MRTSQTLVGLTFYIGILVQEVAFHKSLVNKSPDQTAAAHQTTTTAGDEVLEVASDTRADEGGEIEEPDDDEEILMQLSWRPQISCSPLTLLLEALSSVLQEMPLQDQQWVASKCCCFWQPSTNTLRRSLSSSSELNLL